jgi:NifU-like protein involved in Fe-S cluster formation
MKSRASPVNGMNPYGYPEPVWRLFTETPRAGRFGNGSAVSGTAATPASRSVLSLHFKTVQGRVSDARFQAYGCPTTIAVGAWLAEQVIGRPLAELSALSSEQIRQGLEIPDERAHCALLGEDAIKAVLAAVAAGEPGRR